MDPINRNLLSRIRRELGHDPWQTYKTLLLELLAIKEFETIGPQRLIPGPIRQKRADLAALLQDKVVATMLHNTMAVRTGEHENVDIPLVPVPGVDDRIDPDSSTNPFRVLNPEGDPLVAVQGADASVSEKHREAYRKHIDQILECCVRHRVVNTCGSETELGPVEDYVFPRWLYPGGFNPFETWIEYFLAYEDSWKEGYGGKECALGKAGR